MAAASVGMLVALESGGVMVEKGRKKLRSIYWRLRAEMRRQLRKKRGRQQRFSFHYDPFSYALNFDDGFKSLF